MTEQYTAPEGATHQNIGMPDLFYKAGSDGKVLYRRAVNLSPDDIWEPSGYGGNALANTTVFRPLTPTWRDRAPPEVGWYEAAVNIGTLNGGLAYAWDGNAWSEGPVSIATSRGRQWPSRFNPHLNDAMRWRAPRLTGPDWPEPAESKPKEYAPGVWHEWAGGECPIPPDHRFCYVRRDEPGKPCRASSGSDCYEWRHRGRWNEIIKFWIGSCLDEARSALEKPAEGPRFTPRNKLPEGLAFVGCYDDSYVLRDIYFKGMGVGHLVWKDGGEGVIPAVNSHLYVEMRRLAIERGLWSPPEATIREVRKVDKDPQCRTPKDIEGEPAALERIAAMPKTAMLYTPAQQEAYHAQIRKAEARRSLLTIATPDHRLGYWGTQGDE